MDSNIMVQQTLYNLYILLYGIFLMEYSMFEIDNTVVLHSKSYEKVYCCFNDAVTGHMNTARRCWKLCHIIKADLERGHKFIVECMSGTLLQEK